MKVHADIEASAVEPPSLGSMKIVDHVKDHKRKYATCTIVSIAAIVIGCVLGIVAAVVSSTGGSSALEKQLSAVKGTSLQRVSPIPAKGPIFSFLRFEGEKSL